MNKRGSGVLLHVTSLDSRYGIGDMGPAAYSFADSLSDAKQSFWQILPLSPTEPRHANSPYYSVSAFAGNPILVSPEELVKEGLLSGSDVRAVPSGSDLIDYEKVFTDKKKMLEKAFRAFIKNKRSRDGYERFLSEEGYWLEDYALFKAIDSKFRGMPWNKWPAELRDRDPSSLSRAKNELSEKIEKERFSQYLTFKQWYSLRAYSNAKGIKIIGDVPIYTSYHSADVWVNQNIFKLDRVTKRPSAVSGVPPDYFSSTGQLWNNPVYDWIELKNTGYDWWLKRVKHAFRSFDVVRIDHFRGLVQYWEIPAGEKTAVKGHWEDVPTYELFDVFRRDIPGFPVIAEDLGVITDDVRRAMEHYGLPGMKVLLFAFGNDDPEHPYLPHNFDKHTVAYTGTHDNNTISGWLAGEASAKEKKRLCAYLDKKGTGPGTNWEMIRLLMMSVADTVIIPLQDVLGLGGKARMNLPGTASGNWRWKLRPGELKKKHLVTLAEMAKVYGRAGIDAAKGGKSAV